MQLAITDVELLQGPPIVLVSCPKLSSKVLSGDNVTVSKVNIYMQTTLSK